MIVRDIMATKLITIAPDDTLSHAANLLRQYQKHQLPVVRSLPAPPVELTDATTVDKYTRKNQRKVLVVLEGVLTSQDIDLAVALDRQDATNNVVKRTWQERRVVEVMHRALIRVSPSTSVAAAAQILVDRGIHYLPVVEYNQVQDETQALLVGLLTRSDLLLALARSLGAFEPGMQLDISLPFGNYEPLARTLRHATELHIQVRSVLAAPLTSTVPTIASLRLGTINPTPLLVRLQSEGIEYSLAHQPSNGEADV